MAVLIGAACGSGWLARGTPLDPNFTETIHTNAGAHVTGIAWAPDGSNRLFVSRQSGEIIIIKDRSTLPTPFATVSPVFTNMECGLLGICFDPNFMVNGYVYTFVTVSSNEQQIIRYTAVGDMGTNKTVLIAGLPTRGQNHNGGAIGVGPDGKLYWGIGDNGIRTGVGTNLTSLGSKIGRANLDGSVPADNPFVDGPGGNNDYIWARGFRNPFTFTFQPDTGRLWVNSVGEVYEQIFLVRAGDNAGWDDPENTQSASFITPKIKYLSHAGETRYIEGGTGAVRTGNVATFTTTFAHGFRQGEKLTIAGVGDPSFNGMFYVASPPTPATFKVAQNGADATNGGGSATTQDQGGAVTGGCFYDSTGVPAGYRGNLFYGDFMSGKLMRATLGPTNEVLSVDFFATGGVWHVDMAVGPDGALYCANYFDGKVYRLAYNFTQQQLVATPTVVRMVEGGTTALTVRLATAPAQNVQVNVAATSGDSDITVAAGSTLTFTPGNWQAPQVVHLHAAFDGDSIGDIATLTVSASGLASETISVHALDVFPVPFSVGPVTRQSPGAAIHVGLTGNPGKTYVLEGNTNFLPPWAALSTNKLVGRSTNIVDFDSTNLPLRLYRARQLD